MKFIPGKKLRAAFVSLFAILFVAAGFLVRLPAAAEDASAAANSIPESDLVWRLNIPTGDNLWNPADGKLYVTLPSRYGAGGNSLARLDPLTGVVTPLMFVGSEPGELALADDGRTMYVALNGSASARRVDLVTQTAAPPFSFGWDLGGRYAVREMAVAPGNPQRLAVARTGGGRGGVAVFENDAQSGTPESSFPGSETIAFADSTRLITRSSSQLRVLGIDSSGIISNAVMNDVMDTGVSIRVAGGRVYTSRGKVYSAADGTLVGAFPAPFSFPFTVDIDNNRVFSIVQNGIAFELRVYDATNFQTIGSVPLGLGPSQWFDLSRWGTNGLAARTSANEIVFITTSLIPTSDPIPAPSITATPTPTPAQFATNVRLVDIPASDVLYISQTGTLLATVGSAGGAIGNSVVAIDPMTSNIGAATYIGSEPGPMALASDGRTAWVGLSGGGAVRRFDAVTRRAGDRFSVGTGMNNEPWTVADIAIAPDHPGLLGVSRGSRNGSLSSGLLSVYIDGVRRPVTGLQPASGSITNTFGADGSTVYTFDSFNFINAVTLGPDGGTVTNRFPATSGRLLRYGGGLLYTSRGQIVETAGGLMRGTFPLNNFSSREGLIVVDEVRGRFFAVERPTLTNWQIGVFDLSTFIRIGSIPLVDNFDTQTGFCRWGANGLALSNGSRLYFIQSTLVDPDTPVVPSTPSPTPTPTQTPTPTVASYVRRVALNANGIAYSPLTDSIYASVGAAGTTETRNTVTRIIPATGAISTSVAIGPEPSLMTIAEDGDSIFVRLDGVPGIRRFSAATNTPGSQFAVSRLDFAQDMFVLPGTSRTIALAEGTFGTSVYDDGIHRPAGAGGNENPITKIIPSTIPNIYYGNGGGGALMRFEVGPIGVKTNGFTGDLFGGPYKELKQSAGLVYASNGRVADPETQALAGTFPATADTIAIDPVVRRAFFLNGNIMSVFDADTYRLLDRFSVGIFQGTPANLVRWGSNGLAFVVRGSASANQNGIYLVQTAWAGPGDVPRVVELTSTATTGIEGQAAPSVTVRRFGSLDRVSTVRIKTADGSAVAGEDFEAVDTTLVFESGESTKTIPITIIDDRRFEPTETFTISITESSEEISPTSSAVISITSDDPRPVLGIYASSTFEPAPGAGPTFVTAEVYLTNPNSVPVTVNYATSAQTATSGIDFTPVSGFVRFEPGETRKTIQIPILPDGRAESAEYFDVLLTNWTNVVLANSRTSVEILNYSADRHPKLDFDADFKSEIGVFRPSTGEWWYRQSTDGVIFTTQFGVEGDQPVPADYTGDGRADVAVFRPSTGEWFIGRSENGSYFSFRFGMAGDIPVPGDYDGDGFADAAVFRPSDATWYIAASSDGTQIRRFGADGDRPAPADFDGDGATDIAVFRPSTGQWWIISSSSQITRTVAFGIPGDIPGPVDVDLDLSPEIAVFRPSEGNWYILANESTGAFDTLRFGQNGDIPVPGAYRGRMGNIAVFRPTESRWYFLLPNGVDFETFDFGLTGDVPLASPR